MRRSDDRDATVLLLVACGVAVVYVSRSMGRWVDAVSGPARSPLVAVLAGAMLCAVVAGLLLRARATRRALRRRVRVALIPADTFSPDPEAVVRFAATLARSRRLRDLLVPRACAVRIQLEPDEVGRLRYVVELPDHARPALGIAAAGYGHVELHDLDPGPSTPPGGEVVRTELVSAHPSVKPLREVGIKPDPLTGFAQALATVRPEDEQAVVCVDLLPITPGQRRRARRGIVRKALGAQRRQREGGILDQLRVGDDRPAYRALPVERLEKHVDTAGLTQKLGSPEPLFEIQVLVRACSPAAGRAVVHAQRLVAAFDAFAGENHFRSNGVRLPVGAGFLGADAPWRRRRFDRRVDSGLFAPARRRIVTASEIAGLLKPPSESCASANVVRSGGVIPRAPRGLPSFTGQPGVLPLGRVHDGEEGERLIGVPVEGTFFTYMAGRSRYGKTETGIAQFLHLARTGQGCFFLDPHEDAIERIKHYLRDGERERLIEVNFADQASAGRISWNLLAGRRPAEQKLDAVVDAFASALRWDEVNARALNLTTQAAKALIDLAAKLDDEDTTPTIFQIPTLLGDERWRNTVLPHVSPPTRAFFRERFPLLSREAITPVTNLIDRLRISPAVASVLGSSRSAYDVRAAMDAGKIVLACPGSGSTRDRLVANFLVYDLLHAAKTRATLDPAKRRPFYVFLDEVQTYDGASSGNLAALLEQTAKYGIRAFLFNQSPERLTKATLNAVTTNRSHLLTTALNARAAALLAGELGRAVAPETISRLERYTYLASLTLDGAATPPFLVHGVPANELYEAQPPAESSAPADDGDEPSAEDALDTLDARILRALKGGGRNDDETARPRSRRPA